MNLNFLLIIFVVVLLLKLRGGYKRGMVKEVILLVSLLISGIAAALIANGLKSYNQGQVFHVAVMVILLSLLGLVHLLLKPIFLSAKLISKIPIVSWLDKLLGMVVGLAETVLLLWILYFFVMIMEMGSISEQILQYTKDNQLLRWFFDHNYLALLLEKIGQNVQFLPDLLK